MMVQAYYAAKLSAIVGRTIAGVYCKAGALVVTFTDNTFLYLLANSDGEDMYFTSPPFKILEWSKVAAELKIATIEEIEAKKSEGQKLREEQTEQWERRELLRLKNKYEPEVKSD